MPSGLSVFQADNRANTMGDESNVSMFSTPQLEQKIQDLRRRIDERMTNEPAILRRIIDLLSDRTCILPDEQDEFHREANEVGHKSTLENLIHHVCSGSNNGYENVEQVFALVCAERTGSATRSGDTKAEALQLVTVTPSSDGPAEMTLVHQTLETLEAQLQHGIPISVLSVAGATRQGKSTLLNVFLRYLTNDGWTNQNWLETDHSLLSSGFKAGSGLRPITSGIWVWSKVLQIRKGEIARQIILMDSEGLFDCNQEEDLMSRIFAITIVCSSTIIFTIKDLERHHLNHLTIFTNHMDRAAERTRNLKKEFIIRIKDWQHSISCDKNDDAQAVRDKLARIKSPKHRAMLERLSASQRLLPSTGSDKDSFEWVNHPAAIPTVYLTATPDSNYIDSCNLFAIGKRAPPTPAELGIRCLQSIVAMTTDILQLPGLPYLQGVDGSVFTPAQFCEMLRIYLAQINSQEKLPNIADPYCHIFLQEMINAAVSHYRGKMKALCVNATPSTLLAANHSECAAEAYQLFHSKPSGLSESDLKAPVGQIEAECKTAYEDFVENNEKLCNEMFRKELWDRVRAYRQQFDDLLTNGRGCGDDDLQMKMSIAGTSVWESLQRELCAFANKDDKENVKYQELLRDFKREIRTCDEVIELKNRRVRSDVIQEIADQVKQALNDRRDALIKRLRLSFTPSTVPEFCEEIDNYCNDGCAPFDAQCAEGLSDSVEYRQARAGIQGCIETGKSLLVRAFYAAAKDYVLQVANNKLSHLLTVDANTEPDASMLNAGESCEEVRRGAEELFANLSNQLKQHIAPDYADVQQHLSATLLVIAGQAQEAGKNCIIRFVDRNANAGLEDAKQAIALEAQSSAMLSSDEYLDSFDEEIRGRFLKALGQSCAGIIQSSYYTLKQASTLNDIHGLLEEHRKHCNDRKLEKIGSDTVVALQHYKSQTDLTVGEDTPWLPKRELQEVDTKHLREAQDVLKQATAAFTKDKIYIKLKIYKEKLQDDAARYRDREVRLEEAVNRKDMGTVWGATLALGQTVACGGAGCCVAALVISNPVGLAAVAIASATVGYSGLTALAGARQLTEYFDYNKKAASVLYVKGAAGCNWVMNTLPGIKQKKTA